MIASDYEDAKKKKEQIKEVCKKLNLVIFTKNEFIDLINRENNALGRKFNFEKDNLKDIKKRFSEFF